MALTRNNWLLTFLIVIVVLIDAVHSKLIDLSHDLSMESAMAPDNPKYKRTNLFTGDLKPGVHLEFNEYSIGEHGGTHMDAPKHFVPGGRSLHQIPLEDTMVNNGVMVDCSNETAQDKHYKATVEKLMEWETINGKIPDGVAVIFNFNWSSRYPNPNLFYDTDNLTDTSTYRYPSISGEAADWMVGQRNVRVIGMDVSGPDASSTDYPVHRRFLEDNRLIVECLKDPGRLPPKGFRFHFSPVKFVNATGVQVRAYAWTFDDASKAPSIDGGYIMVLKLTLLLVLLRIITY